MTDYSKAFEEGLQAAKRTDVARKEIASVFSDFKTQVEKMTGGKILVELDERIERDAQSDIVFSPFRQAKKYLAIVVFNPLDKGNTLRELARWKISSFGYPCILRWGDHEESCGDKRALEEGLASILQDARIGEKILYAMNFEKPKEPPKVIEKK